MIPSAGPSGGSIWTKKKNRCNQVPRPLLLLGKNTQKSKSARKSEV
ncbi:hypothetical protein [Aestuariicoccus sp. MJ-SS9]|nr:hypothetical protein [Aestuariicoccus sp. MJ-SS9]MDU8910629.1 hypothetical protein [Aestuariicoccus sp. MJ-SS9]